MNLFFLSFLGGGGECQDQLWWSGSLWLFVELRRVELPCPVAMRTGRVERRLDISVVLLICCPELRLFFFSLVSLSLRIYMHVSPADFGSRPASLVCQDHVFNESSTDGANRSIVKFLGKKTLSAVSCYLFRKGLQLCIRWRSRMQGIVSGRESSKIVLAGRASVAVPKQSGSSDSFRCVRLRQCQQMTVRWPRMKRGSKHSRRVCQGWC